MPLGDRAKREPTPKQTKTKTSAPNDIENLFKPKMAQPLTKIEPTIIPNDASALDMRKASQNNTLKATSNIRPTDQIRSLMQRMQDIELDTDLPAYPEPQLNTQVSTKVNTKNLPAIAGQSLQAAGIQTPAFHQVANLPGNMSAMIRQLGRKLFKQFTNTPTDNIHMVANLGGHGPNTPEEVRAVANWVRNTGKDLGDCNINFDAIMPGYEADVRQFSLAGIRWFLVKDMGGQYIYSWPESDSIDYSNTKRLK